LTILSVDVLKDRITDDIDYWLKEYEKDGFDKILINPLPDFKENDLISIDLHLGDEMNFHTEIQIIPIEKDGVFLDSGETINVITSDYIGLPRNVAGFVIPKLTCTIQGLSHISTRVDPGFHGKLVETLSNLDRTKIKIKPGFSFCSLIFFEVKGVSRLYRGHYSGQKSLNNVIEKLDELYKKQHVNPSINPIVNRKDVLAIASKALSKDVLATLGCIIGGFILIGSGIPSNILPSMFSGVILIGLALLHMSSKR